MCACVYICLVSRVFSTRVNSSSSLSRYNLHMDRKQDTPEGNADGKLACWAVLVNVQTAHGNEQAWYLEGACP